MISLKKAVVAATIAIAASGAAFADGHKAVSKPAGLYLDGGVGANFTTIRTKGNGGSVNVESAFSKVGVNVNAGYKVNQYFAPEVGYTNFGTGLQSVDAAVKGFLPLNAGLYGMNLLGKVGVAHIYDSNSSTNGALAGVGFDYGLSKNVDWNVNAQGVLVDRTEFKQSVTGLLSTGLTYYFG